MPGPFEPYTDMSKPGVYHPNGEDLLRIVPHQEFDSQIEVDNDRFDVVVQRGPKTTKVFLHRRK